MLEIRSAKDAHELLLSAFNDKRSLDEPLVKEFQYRLMQNTGDSRRWRLGERPGEYKRYDHVTGKNEIGAAPEDVQEEITELLSEMRGIPDDKVLPSAAYFHAKFENIHPFADGNGRTGWLVNDYRPPVYTSLIHKKRLHSICTQK